MNAKLTGAELDAINADSRRRQDEWEMLRDPLLTPPDTDYEKGLLLSIYVTLIMLVCVVVSAFMGWI